MFASLARFASPAYYQGAFANMAAAQKPRIQAGAFMPAIHFMMFVGTLGYIQEYYAIGQYHANHRIHTTDAALAEYKAKHGDGH